MKHQSHGMSWCKYVHQNKNITQFIWKNIQNFAQFTLVNKFKYLYENFKLVMWYKIKVAEAAILSQCETKLLRDYQEILKHMLHNFQEILKCFLSTKWIVPDVAGSNICIASSNITITSFHGRSAICHCHEKNLL